MSMSVGYNSWLPLSGRAHDFGRLSEQLVRVPVANLEGHSGLLLLLAAHRWLEAAVQREAALGVSERRAAQQEQRGAAAHCRAAAAVAAGLPESRATGAV